MVSNSDNQRSTIAISARAGVAPSKCSACGQPLAAPLICGQCHALHSPAGVDHFTLLGLPRAYEIDRAALRRTYLELSRQTHPDRLPQTADSTEGLRLSARLNDAYRVLADPVLRAEYLLELAGGKSAAEDKSVPPDVLSQTLIIREEIEEARASGDTDSLTRLKEMTMRSLAAALERIAALAAALPGDQDDQARLRVELNAVKYHQRILEQLN